MRFSSNIIAGMGSIKSLWTNIEDLKLPRDIVIISGKKTFDVAGKLVYNVISQESPNVTAIVDDVKPTNDFVKQLKEKLKNSGPSKHTIVAVGGGSVVDVCKFISKELEWPLVAIPTTLSSDAIATSFSVLWGNEKNEAISTVSPSIVIGDYDILKNQPKRFISAGVGDMISKYTALYDWRLGFWFKNEAYNEFAARIAESTSELLISRIEDVSKMNYIGIETLFLAEITDAYLMELSGTTRVAAGSEHLFSFAMETETAKGMHGEYCGLGSIMMSYLQNKKITNNIRETLLKVSAPTSIDETDIKREQIVRALTKAHKMRNWYTILGENGLSEGSAERLARYTKVATF